MCDGCIKSVAHGYLHSYAYTDYLLAAARLRSWEKVALDMIRRPDKITNLVK